MNFVDAVPQKEGNNVYLHFHNQKVLLLPEKAKKVVDGGYLGKEVVMGIRPEDIHETEAALLLSLLILRSMQKLTLLSFWVLSFICICPSKIPT